MARIKKRTISLILVPLVSLVIMGMLIHDIVQTQDSQLEHERSRFFRAVLENSKRDVSVVAHEFTLWQEAVVKIIDEKDPEWADENIGSYLIDTYDYDATLVLTPDNQEFMRFDVSGEGRRPVSVALLGNEKINQLAQDARSYMPGKFKALGDWLEIEGELYLVGAGAFTYQETYETKATIRTPSENHVLLTFTRADAAYWKNLAKQFGLPDLFLNDNRKSGLRVPLKDRNGALMAHLTMAGQTGVIQSIFNRYGLAVALLTMLLAGFAIYAMKRSIDYKKAHDEVLELNAHMDELVEKRTVELEAALEDAEAASRAKSTFLSSMSHEFRTPLNGILGFTQLLEINGATTLNDKQKKWIEQINSAGELLLALVNDVLDMAHVESGKISLELSALQPRDVFKQCHDIVSPMATDRKITLKGVPETDRYIMVDRLRLQQVVLNVMNNAIKYNFENGRVDFGCFEHNSQTMRLYVKDTGPGIPTEYQQRIFEPFYRMDNVTHVTEGSGVGLALVVRLTEAMGGKVSLESAPGQGTTFNLDFPIYEGPHIPAEK